LARTDLRWAARWPPNLCDQVYSYAPIHAKTL